VEASLVVGADGATSLVREALGLPAKLHRYRHGYLIVQFPRLSGMDEARYYVGQGELLGLVPSPEDRLVALYMIEASGVNDFKARGLDSFKQRLAAIDPAMRIPLESLTAWEQVGFLPAFRVRAEHWVTDGAVVIGDAAHAMNPHASQGRMQAMADAMVLADVIMKCRRRGIGRPRPCRNMKPPGALRSPCCKHLLMNKPYSGTRQTRCAAICATGSFAA